MQDVWCNGWRDINRQTGSIHRCKHTLIYCRLRGPKKQLYVRQEWMYDKSHHRLHTYCVGTRKWSCSADTMVKCLSKEKTVMQKPHAHSLSAHPQAVKEDIFLSTINLHSVMTWLFHSTRKDFSDKATKRLKWRNNDRT